MDLSTYIDHTILIPNCTDKDIKRVCEEAIKHNFFAVCIPPYYVRSASRLLEDTGVKISTVVGFPLGYAAIPAKVEEIKRAIDEGADEIDIVANIAAVKNGDWAHVRNDIDGVTIAVHLKGKKIKMIIEVALLEEDELLKLCKICGEVGVDFVKTSTGYEDSVSIEQVKSLRSKLPTNIKIAVAGNVQTTEAAEQMVAVGVDRIGTYSGVAITKTEPTES